MYGTESDFGGIVTTLDLLRAAADHRLVTRTYIFDRTHPHHELES